jgi:hypothetical protein
MCPAPKVPGQCSFVLLVEVHLRRDIPWGSAEGGELGSGLCYEQRREVEQGLYCA